MRARRSLLPGRRVLARPLLLIRDSSVSLRRPVGIGRLPAVLGLACAVLGGCARTDGPAAPASPPNLLLIVVDTLRADALDDPATTPHLNRLADESTIFRNALSLIPATGPSHSTLFTGRTPFSHGVRLNSQVLPEQETTLAELLQAAGYTTAAVVSLGVLRSQYGFAQGFAFYDERFPTQWFRLGNEITDSAVAWLRGHAETPFFLFVHYSDPHEPYGRPDLPFPEFRILLDGQEVARGRADGLRRLVDLELTPGGHDLELVPPGPIRRQLLFRGLRDRSSVRLELGDEWRQPPAKDEINYLTTLPARLRVINDAAEPTRSELPIFVKEVLSMPESVARYAGEVSYADEQIGRLLDELELQGRGDQTVVVLTSDHGEGLGDHQLLGHVEQLYQSLVHVPLMVRRTAAAPRGEARTDFVSHVDVLPTVLSLLGLSAPPGLPGRDLFQAGTTAAIRPVVGATFPPLARRSLRSLTLDGYRLIWNQDDGATELFHLPQDPGELHDLSGVETERTRRYLDILERFLAQADEGAATAAVPILTEEEREQLRALGYLQ